MKAATRIGSIASAALPWVHKFLNRAVRNFESYKQLPRDFYLDRFQQIGLSFPNPDFQPKFHQLVCIYLSIRFQTLMLLVDLGLGKTATMLHTMKGLRLRGQAPKKMLVLVPTLVLIGEWEKEAAKHRPDLKFVNMNGGDTRERFAQVHGEGDIFCLNYDGLTAMLTDLMYEYVDLGGKKHHSKLPPVGIRNPRRKRVINPKKMTEFLNLFSVVVLDEITAVKNPKSTLFKICKEFVKAIPCRFGLTGTPFGRNLEDLWGEYFVIDGGESLGRSKYMYEQAFFDIKQNFFGGVDKTFKRELIGSLKRLMYNSAIRYQQEECADLPPVTHMNMDIPMPPEMTPFYGKIHKQLTEIFTGKNSGSTQSVEQLWIQSREVCSNFINLKDPTTGVMMTIPIPGEAKLERLTQLVQDMPEGCKMVVFHDFIYSGKRIEANLTAHGIQCLRIDGATKNRDDILSQFTNDPAKTVIILNSSIGALGLNLQVANYVAFYEIPVDPIVYQQALARCARTGQTKPVFVYNFFIQQSVEQQVLKYVNEGRNLRTQLLHNPAATLRALGAS